mmetsp:Transcript_33141/g.70053  ORF Transcript_33141/g.70053 Transcript_33141/m.70053 type:complete len:176 (+) Transcript_33141:75-602(+)
MDSAARTKLNARLPVNFVVAENKLDGDTIRMNQLYRKVMARRQPVSESSALRRAHSASVFENHGSRVCGGASTIRPQSLPKLRTPSVLSSVSSHSAPRTPANSLATKWSRTRSLPSGGQSSVASRQSDVSAASSCMSQMRLETRLRQGNMAEPITFQSGAGPYDYTVPKPFVMGA